MTTREDEWLWGWDETPGIVSVWAEPDGRAFVWRRRPDAGLVREDERFRPWILLASLAPLARLGSRLVPEGDGPRAAASRGQITYERLEGDGLAFVVRADDGRVLEPFAKRGREDVLWLPPEEQYLVATGRTYFRDLAFDELRRLSLDLETTSLHPDRGRIFLVAVRAPDGRAETLEATRQDDDDAEADLLARLVARITELDPDVIENHNLHGFDLPFLAERARRLGVPLALGRAGKPGLRKRPSSRGASMERGEAREDDPMRRMRYTVPGRELIDTMDAVRRHDFAARDLPGHGLKAVAAHFGIAGRARVGPHAAREMVPGHRIHEVFLEDPARIRRYAEDDVEQASGVARLLGGAAFALARMAPRRYERLADAGAATGVLDPLLVRAYLRSKTALPLRESGDGTAHSGAALHLFATGVAERIAKADVASLYPSLMRQYRIGPARDRLGVLVSLVGRLVEQRLAAKHRARTAPPGSPARYTDEALSAAMKLVVNSAYGYMGAAGLTRFSDVHAANEVTRRGRELLALLCRELAARDVTPLEADTDGVYFAVPASFDEADERRVVTEVAALLPPLVQLELEGRYRAMLSHEPKNYALAPYGDGPVVLRGVAFRSSRAEPFGEAFLRAAVARLLAGDVAGVRAAYVDTVLALRRRELPTRDVTARVRLTKTPSQYLASRGDRRELPYEAMLAAGRVTWDLGERVRVYRRAGDRPGLLTDTHETHDARDYDVEHYVAVLTKTFAERLARGLTPRDFAAVIEDPMQVPLFPRALEGTRPILTMLVDPRTLDAPEAAGR